jgi:hypothetical protein
MVANVATAFTQSSWHQKKLDAYIFTEFGWVIKNKNHNLGLHEVRAPKKG